MNFDTPDVRVCLTYILLRVSVFSWRLKHEIIQRKLNIWKFIRMTD